MSKKSKKYESLPFGIINEFHEFDDFDEDYFEQKPSRKKGNYDKIVDDDNPRLISNISMLRHHLNCHGLSDELLDYLGINENDLELIVSFAEGDTPISRLRKEPEQFLSMLEERKRGREAAEEKNDRLLDQLDENKDNYCGMGLRKTKLLLNKYVKAGDPAASALRTALEAEHINIQAKNTPFPYRDKAYQCKERKLNDLIQLCRENGYVYGKQETDNRLAPYILYFELPGCRQISFHCADEPLCFGLPDYGGEWDGEECSTMPKLESAILEIFKKPVPKLPVCSPDYDIYIFGRRNGCNHYAAATCQICSRKEKRDPFFDIYGKPQNEYPELEMMDTALRCIPENVSVRLHLTSSYILYLLKNKTENMYACEKKAEELKNKIRERNINLLFVHNSASAMCMQPCISLCEEQKLSSIL